MKRFFRLPLLLACCALTFSSLAQEPLALVEISSYQQLSADVTSLGLHIGNPMLNMGLLFLGNLIGAPGMLGIDQDRPLRLVVFTRDGGFENVEVVLALPVEGEGLQYLEALKVNYDQVEEDGLLRRFRANRDVRSFNNMSLALHEGYALVSPSAPLVTKVTEWLKDDPAYLSISGVNGSLRFQLEPGTVLPRLKKELQEDKLAAEAVAEEGLDTIYRNMVRHYQEAAITFLEEIEVLQLGLQCNELGITAFSRAAAKPESRIAKLLGAVKPVDERLGKLLPRTEDAPLVLGSGAMKAVIDVYGEAGADMLAKVFATQMELVEQINPEADEAAPPIDVAAWEKLIKQSFESWNFMGDDFVLSVGRANPKAPVALFEAMTVTDGEKFLESWNRYRDLSNETQLNPMVDVRIVEREKRTYNGIEVLVSGFEIKKTANDEEEKDGDNEDAADGEVDDNIMQAMKFFEEVTIEMAVTDDLMLITFGRPLALDDYLARLNIDDGNHLDDRIAKLFPDLKSNAEAFLKWGYSPLALMKQFLPNIQLLDGGFQMPGFDDLPDEGAGIGGLTMAGATTVQSIARISAAQIKAFVKFTQNMQAEMMQQRRTAAPGEVQGEPVEVIIPEN